jgi:hypothetical protein
MATVLASGTLQTTPQQTVKTVPVRRPPFIVSIYADAFIQLDRLPFVPPFPYFAFEGDGNGRPFARLPGRCRIWSQITVDLTAPSPVVSQGHDSNPTTGYYYKSKTYVGPAGPYQLPDTSVEYSDTAKAGTGGMTESASRSGSSVVVSLRGVGTNPIQLGAPAIDYAYNITLTPAGDLLKYSVSGSHDGFPWYGLFIGDALVERHHAYERDQTPLSLFPPMEFGVSTSGTLSRGQASVGA